MRKRRIVYVCIGAACLIGIVSYTLAPFIRNDSKKDSLRTGINVGGQFSNDAQRDSKFSDKNSETSKSRIARCTTSALATKVELVEKDTKNVWAELIFTNRSEQTCTIGGFPRVSLLNATGKVVGRLAEENGGGKHEPFILKPLENVASTLYFRASSGDDGACKDGVTQLSIYPPGATDEVISTTPYDMWCPGFSITTLTKK